MRECNPGADGQDDCGGVLAVDSLMLKILELAHSQQYSYSNQHCSKLHIFLKCVLYSLKAS